MNFALCVRLGVLIPIVCYRFLSDSYRLEKKEDLIAALKAADSTLSQDQPNNQPIVTEQQTLINRGHSPEELREIATIADEIRHLRKQWLSQAMKSGSTTVSQGRK